MLEQFDTKWLIIDLCFSTNMSKKSVWRGSITANNHYVLYFCAFFCRFFVRRLWNVFINLRARGFLLNFVMYSFAFRRSCIEQNFLRWTSNVHSLAKPLFVFFLLFSVQNCKTTSFIFYWISLPWKISFESFCFTFIWVFPSVVDRKKKQENKNKLGMLTLESSINSYQMWMSEHVSTYWKIM